MDLTISGTTTNTNTAPVSTGESAVSITALISVILLAASAFVFFTKKKIEE